ncbi:MAG: hypothetical protein JSW67_11240 [Candidatus Latescibacterota bacterium]|nr:MAG: hypothetical protein JSW67_11240 [Candidatus Latescibacterota bacterium]
MREAFADYLRVLRPGGAVALLVNDDLLQRKLIRTAAEVLEAQGVDAASSIAGVTSALDSPYDRLILVNSQPFSTAQRAQLATEVRQRGYDEVQHASSAEPASDDRPFVFHTRGAIPRALLLLLATASALLLVAWSAVGWVGRAAPRQSAVTSGYFVLLGVAFMMVEVLALQKSILIIGYPTLNLAVILATFLLAAGLGSAASSRIAPSLRRLRLLVLLLGALLLLLVPLLDAVHARSDTWPLALRCMALAALLFPFAFLMGMPFPVGIRHLPPHLVAMVPWIWGLNGTGSILGSAVAVAVVLEAGFRVTVLLPALAYVLAAVLTPALESTRLPLSGSAKSMNPRA